MEIIQTTNQKKGALKPSRFEQLNELSKRVDVFKFEHTSEEYSKLEKGYHGESDFEKYLLENSEPHWRIVKNIWLDYKGVFECDFLVFTQAGGYLFEIKNYTGKYEYKENQWFRNGNPNSHNPLSQIQKAKINLEMIFKQVGNILNIRGFLVFIGEFNQVFLQEQPNGIQIVQRNQLMDVFWQMKQEERNFLGYPPDNEEVMKQLAKYETENPYQKEPIVKEVFDQIKPGICCSQCANFELQLKNGFYICTCGFYEPKEHAILRTICEYGILYADKNFKTSELFKFFGGDLSKRTLIRILNKYFRKVGSNRGTEYINQVIRPDQIQKVFHLTGNSYLKIEK